MRRPQPTTLAEVGLLAAAYWLAAYLGLQLAVVHPSSSAVWPASGLAVGVLLIGRMGLWPGVFLGALAANLQNSGHWPSSLAIAAGNTLEAVVAAGLLHRFAGGARALERPRGIVWFAAGAVAVAPLASSLVGPTALASFGLLPWQSWSAVWTTWYLGDALGIVTVTPLMIAFATQSDPRRNLASTRESVALAATFIAVAVLIYSPLRPSFTADVQLSALLLIPILWSANRQPLRNTVLMAATVAVLALAATNQPIHDPRPDSTNLALLHAQSMGAAAMLLALFIAAMVKERDVALDEAATLHNDLETEVARRTEDLSATYRIAHMGAWTYRPSQGLRASKELQELLRVPLCPSVSDLLMLLATEVRRPTAERLRTLATARESFVMQVRLAGKLQRHMEIRAAPSDDGWRGTVQDITETKEATSILRLHAGIVASSPIPISQVADDGTVLSWNPACEDLYGVPAREMEGRSIFSIVPPEDVERTERMRRSVLAGTIVRDWECERLHADGSRIPVALTLAPVSDETGAVTGLSVMSRDLRPQREAEAIAAEARRVEKEVRALEAVNAFKSEFINMASHELRTPLTPIRMQLHILGSGRLGELGPKQKASIEVISRNMQRLGSLVDDVFSAAKLQSGGLGFDPTNIAVSELVEDAATAFEAQAEQRDIRIEAKVSHRKTLRADRDRLTQVLFNLMSNALRYTPDGGTIRVGSDDLGDRITLFVEDTGPGIPPDKQRQLFQPFQRLGATDREGTGLGLYICKGIAELHGGHIDVRNGPEGGARFVVTLPKKRSRRPGRPTPGGKRDRLALADRV